MSTFYPENIPQEMKDIPQWILWKLEKRGENLTKVPYHVNGKKADTTKSESWTTYERVFTAYESSIYAGLGFVLTKETGLVAIYLDHVLHNSISSVEGSTSKEWDNGILSEIQDFNSYAEFSQSGGGVHIFCKGTMPKAGRKKGNHEMYCDNRFFAVTGDHLAGTPKIVNEAQDCIDVYYQLWFEGHETTNNSNEITSPIMDDEGIVKLASSARNGDKFRKLNAGDITDYPSHSEAELAYCGILAFYTQNKEQIDRIYRTSKLYNKKWDRCGKYALEKVIRGLTEVYTGKNGFITNTEDVEELKEMTFEEIELLKKGFAARHLTINLPDDHFIVQVVKYLDRMTDGYKEYKILGAFYLLSSCTQRKPVVDLSTTVNGVFTNLWTQFIGISSISRKSTIIDFIVELLSYAMPEPLTDTDPSMEAYVEGLSLNSVQPMVYDEVSTLFQKMNQKYNSGYFEFECKIYDCKSHEKRLASGGKREPKTYLIREPFVTKLYGTTFVKYKRSMTIPDFDSGYGFRFLFAAPTYDLEERLPHVRTPEDVEERSKCEVRTKKLYDFFSRMLPFSMTIDPDAMDYYNQLGIKTTRKIKYMPYRDLLGAAWSRYQIYILKMAALIELGKSTVSKNICLESIQIASSMVLDYFLPTLCDVYNLLTVDPKNNKIDKITEALKEFKGIANHTDLLRKVRLESREFKSSIATMEESGQIEVIIEKNPKNNKSTHYYQLKSCDEIKFGSAELTSQMISDIQVHELPKLTTHEVDSVKSVSLTNFTQLDNIYLSNKIIQSKNIQTHGLHSTLDTYCESGNLGMLGTCESEKHSIVNSEHMQSIHDYLRNSYHGQQIDIFKVIYDFCQTPAGKKALNEMGLGKIKEILENSLENYVQSFESSIVSVEEAAKILEEEGF